MASQKPAQYLNERIRKDIVESLRRYEKKKKLPASISQTIKHLLNESTRNQRALHKAL